MKRSICFFCFTFLLIYCARSQSFDFSDPAVEQRMRNDDYLLSADSLQGREAGTYGEYMARSYIAWQFKTIGLKPFFGDSSYFQSFTYNDIPTYGFYNHLTVNGKKLKLYNDYYAIQFSANDSVNGEAVFVGYGISAPQCGYDDYYGLKDLEGKIFIIKTSLPEDYNSDNRKKSPVEALSGKTDKVDLAIKKGARAVIFIRPDAWENEPSASLEQVDSVRKIPVIFLRNAELLDTLGKNFADIRIDIDRSKKREAHNVAGFINNGAETWVVIGAHYDHLGYVGNWGIEENPLFAIYNGADDNASGTSGMIELARYLKTSKAKNNNYIFAAFSAEEKGLFGSRYFAGELKKSGMNINYMLNLDMIGRLSSKQKLTLFGTGTSPSWKTAIEQNNEFGFKLLKVKSGLGGSDHMSFYNERIPDIFLFTGTHRDYHTINDDANLVNFSGAVSIVKYAEKMIEFLNDKGKLEFRRTSMWSAFWGALRTL